MRKGRWKKMVMRRRGWGGVVSEEGKG